jgi:cell division septation protein DedD
LPVEETPVVDNYDPDKELSGAEKIYLDDLETDNKESETDDSGATIVAVPLMADSTKSEDAKEEAKADAEEDEKRRKLFPILLIAGIAAAILLISLSVIYFMYLSQSDEQSKIATDTIKAIQEAPTQTVEKQAEPMAEIVTDSADTVELSQPEPEAVVEVMVERKVEPPPSKIETPDKPLAETKPKTSTTQVQKPKVKAESDFAAKKPTTKTEMPKVKEAPKNDDDIVSIIPERKPETKQPLIRDNVKEEFAVQIYASPSKEDANRWLEKLRAQNVVDAFISEQMIRDVKWYRVRFGKYDTREEARAAALRYGFAQTWIDRVK